MQSGIGDAAHLHGFGIPVIEELKGVGRNLQDHSMATGCIWECPENAETGSLPHGAIVQTNAFLRSSVADVSPDIQLMQLGLPFASEEVSRQYQILPKAWTMIPVLARPRSTGQIRLTGAGPEDPVTIEANMLADPSDVAALVSAIEIISEIAQSASLRPFVKRQLAPRPMAHPSLESFVRDSVASINHLTCTAKMGNDADSVVNSRLQVHGVEGLTIADGSVLRRVTTGNTMAPCVIIGERAAASIKQRHKV
jgi:choline dehydrogenase